METLPSLNSIPLIRDFTWESLPIVHSYGWPIPLNALIFYVAVIVYYLPHYMKDRKPFLSDSFVIVWNFILMSFNSLWAIWITALVVKLWLEDGIHGIVCDPEGKFWKGQNMFVVWCFLMSKFVELGDTAILALRRKPIIFLHWYHHVTVLLYCWYAVLTQNSCCIVFGWMNSCVHMFMYYYYWKAAQGKKLWWSKYLTTAQTAQMFIGIVLTANWAFYQSRDGNCLSKDPAGTIWTASIMYTSYFYLFIKFFYMRNTKTGKKGDDKSE